MVRGNDITATVDFSDAARQRRLHTRQNRGLGSAWAERRKKEMKDNKEIKKAKKEVVKNHKEKKFKPVPVKHKDIKSERVKEQKEARNTKLENARSK